MNRPELVKVNDLEGAWALVNNVLASIAEMREDARFAVCIFHVDHEERLHSDITAWQFPVNDWMTAVQIFKKYVDREMIQEEVPGPKSANLELLKQKIQALEDRMQQPQVLLADSVQPAMIGGPTEADEN